MTTCCTLVYWDVFSFAPPNGSMTINSAGGRSDNDVSDSGWIFASSSNSIGAKAGVLGSSGSELEEEDGVRLCVSLFRREEMRGLGGGGGVTGATGRIGGMSGTAGMLMLLFLGGGEWRRALPGGVIRGDLVSRAGVRGQRGVVIDAGNG